MQNVINHLGAPEIICYTAKAFKGQFSLLSGVFEVSWNIDQSHTLSMGASSCSHPAVCTGHCHQGLSVALPHLLGTDLAFSGMEQHKSDCTGVTPLCCAVLRFVAGNGSGQPQTSLLHLGHKQSTDELQRK